MTSHISAASHTVEHQDLAEEHLNKGSADSSKFVGKNVTKWPVENNIIQRKIRQLKKQDRAFKVRKYSDILSTKAENMEVKEELEPSPAKRISLHTEFLSDAHALLYKSKGEKQNFNGEFLRNNELVRCSHFSHYWLEKDKFKYEDISSENAIKECYCLRSDSELEKNLLQWMSIRRYLL